MFNESDRLGVKGLYILPLLLSWIESLKYTFHLLTVETPLPSDK